MNTSPFRTFLALASMFVPAGTAGAQSIEEARTAYAQGRFMEATDLAQGLDTSDGYILAANSLVIYSYYVAPAGEQADLFERALTLARTAVRLDAGNPEAHLQLAHAMGRLAQVAGILTALNEGYASQVRDTIQETLRLDPDMAAAHVSLGAWHAGIIGEGGFMASMLYGANEEDALAHFERARELAPHDKAVLFEYALGLLSLDADAHGEKARALLERSIQLPAKDAYDRIVHQKAVERLAALGKE